VRFAVKPRRFSRRAAFSVMISRRRARKSASSSGTANGVCDAKDAARKDCEVVDEDAGKGARRRCGMWLMRTLAKTPLARIARWL
jgi:hypothetical protein